MRQKWKVREANRGVRGTEGCGVPHSSPQLINFLIYSERWSVQTRLGALLTNEDRTQTGRSYSLCLFVT